MQSKSRAGIGANWPDPKHDDDDVGLHVLGCRVDILGTNCKKLLKVKMSEEGGGVNLRSGTLFHYTK